MRMQWSSALIEGTWRPRLGQIQEMLNQLEVETVRTGFRRGAIFASGLESPQWCDLKETGLYVTPIKISKTEDYSNQAILPGPGDAVTVSALLSRERIAIPKDDREWGRLLGYPLCCIDEFVRNWSNGGMRDPLRWQKDPKLSTTNNVILRIIGVRPVFHLPCSFDCEETFKVARKLKELAFSLGFNEAYGWMEELYSKEFYVTAKNGIGEINHPFFRAMFDSDRDADRPVEYRIDFAKGTVRRENGFETLWTDNGFYNLFDMESAHQGILDELVGLQVESAIDLGAGNGYLAAKVARLLGCKVIAVDSDSNKVARGRESFKNVEFVVGNIDNFYGAADVVLISENRFLEGIDKAHVAKMAKKYLVVYEYDRDVTTSMAFNGFIQIGTHNRRAVAYRAV